MVAYFIICIVWYIGETISIRELKRGYEMRNSFHATEVLFKEINAEDKFESKHNLKRLITQNKQVINCIKGLLCWWLNFQSRMVTLCTRRFNNQ